MKKFNQEEAFTIIELIVVIAIISVVVGIVLGNFNQYREKAFISATVAKVKEVEKATTVFYADTGKLPTGCSSYSTWGCHPEEDPFARPLGVLGWNGPYYHVFGLAHAWGGHIGIESEPARAEDLDGDGLYDKVLIILDYFSALPWLGEHDAPIPVGALQKLDAILDDGDLDTGNARGNGGWWPGGIGTDSGQLMFIFKP